MQTKSFPALGISANVERALAKQGVTEPFPIQSLVIPTALEGSDVLAKSPTGSGKTLAFGLPLVERVDPRARSAHALVLVPTRELALQVAETIAPLAAARGLRTAAVYGGASIAVQAKKSRGAHVLVATPGRLEDMHRRRLVDISAVRILVLDEADRMLDLGFAPQVDRIVRHLPEERQTLLFSATLDGQVGEIAAKYTSHPARFEAEPLVPVEEAGEVEHRFVPVTQEDKLDTLVNEIDLADGLALVFVRTKRGADRLVRTLARHEVAAEAMHGDMSQAARQRALERFRSGRVRTLVATDVAARGLDLNDITHVINYDPPGDDKDYVHRVGRTGRAGRAGNGVTLVLPDQEADVSRVAARLGHRDKFEREGLKTAPPRQVYRTRRRGGRSRW
jgi:superfamily II DNA/RNA helicase